MYKILSIPLVIITVILVSYFINLNDEKELKEQIKEEEYFGRVDSVYLNPDARFQPYAHLSIDAIVPIQNDIYLKIKPNDTLFKRKGDYKYFLISKSDTIIFYQQNGHFDIKD